MSNKNVTPIFEANMEAAMRSHYRRTKESAIDLHMPFDRLISFEDALRLEDDGIVNEAGENTVGDYEMRQRVIGVRGFFRFMKQRVGLSSTATYRPGPISNILLQVFAAGRAIQDPFFSSLSFTENGLLFSQTKAAASNRSKLISGLLKKAGATGIRQPGQKTPEASARYAAKAKGNQNRKGGKRQGSFLRKLEVGSRKSEVTGKARQATFTRKLTSNAAGGAHANQSTEHPPSRKATDTGGVSIRRVA